MEVIVTDAEFERHEAFATQTAQEFPDIILVAGALSRHYADVQSGRCTACKADAAIVRGWVVESVLFIYNMP